MRLFGVCVLAVFMLVTAPAGAADDEGKRTLEGEYYWNVGERGKLTAHFTPTGKADRWNVEFHFNHGGPHVYAGTAEGNLDEGPLSGEVTADARRRTFSFKGSVKAGKFSGTHKETSRGQDKKTGTLELN